MKKILLLFITVILIIGGCEKLQISTDSSNEPPSAFPIIDLGFKQFPDSTPAGLKQWNVLKVEGPSSVQINKVVRIIVTYPTASGCDFVSTFTMAENYGIIMIKAYGITLQNQFCTQAAVPKSITYEVVAIEKGQYTFRFISKDQSYITYNLTVN
jgi:hypothetical protein